MMLHFTHHAMATRFEMWLCGDDPEHMQSVAFQAWAEVDRLEMMMSMHDGRAEIARINREACERPVRIEVELFNILLDAQAWTRSTHGYFNVCCCTTPGSNASDVPFMLDEEKRTVQLPDGASYLDLGGYGKGYALERIRDLLTIYNINSAFVHGGTSSVLATGMQETGAPWVVEIPGLNGTTYPLMNQGFSYSATTGGRDVLQAAIYNPHTHQAIPHESACWVISPDALKAEVLTTTLLAMGRERAVDFTMEPLFESAEVGWL